ncbi:hypothetical protein [Methylorubrum sp. SB2]|uniref:hypothetical protein n=1 Tax=Methylorubrum subtropicum TaxID=3138812 RepID=UPI00313EC3BE
MTAPMSSEEKINDLFIALTERYGALELKPGQQLAVVAESWAASVGQYGMRDISMVLSVWVRTSKFARWPQEAEVLELLRQNGCERERDQRDATPEEWRHAELNGGIWYCHQLFREPLRDGWLRMDVSACIDAMLKRFHSSKAPNTHTRLLARAWKAGAMQPAAWDLHCADWFAKAKDRTRKYYADIARIGARKVHADMAARGGA